AVERRVDVLSYVRNGVAGQFALQLPSGWTSRPEAASFSFSRSGERSAYRFIVSVPSLENRDYRIEAVATVAGRQYRQGYDVIEHRDLETRYLYHPAATEVRGIDVRVARNRTVGSVRG